MRPVTRGDAPRAFSRYQDAIGDLENRLGVYCSYCERRLPIGLAVEHVSPKSSDPARERDWTNFLLGCSNCNSVKGARQTNEHDFLWPDRDNTLRAFAYSKGGFVGTADGLPADILLKAAALMNVAGLDRHPQHGLPVPADRDNRWAQRDNVWKLAERYKDVFADFSETARKKAVTLICDLALGYGFFSVWMTVFTDGEVRAALIASFTGTALDCFDTQGNAIPRPGGRL